MTKGIELRQLTTMEEMSLVQLVEKAVWDMEPIPTHQTYTVVNNGGVMIGAFSNGDLVGFSYSFPGYKDNQSYLCSHLLGILPAYRSSGLGLKIKQKQAKIARTLGYKEITWTFDPLQSINAYLNLNKLGAIGAIYSEDHYGDMTDRLNEGLATDRIHIVWNLTEKRVKNTSNITKARTLLHINKHDQPILTTENFTNSVVDEDAWFIAVPTDFQEMKQTNNELAKQWRFISREAFQLMFQNGYYAHDMIRKQATNYYVFIKKGK